VDDGFDIVNVKEDILQRFVEGEIDQIPAARIVLSIISDLSATKD
jgi:hypothetical protein